MAMVVTFALASACGGGSATEVSSSQDLDSATAEPEQLESEPDSTGSVATPEPTVAAAGGGDEESSQESTAEDAVVAFVAALEEALADTSYAGEALESPEVFVATAQLFCDQLTAGVSPDQVLGEYVETLTGSPIEAAGDDELVLAGSLLGVGVGTLCDEHSSLLDGSS